MELHPLPEGVTFPDRHEWPVTLRAGGVVLRPLRWRERRAWQQLRDRNRDWLDPWEPTAPADCAPATSGYGRWLRTMARQAKAGRAVPWVIGWDPDGDASDAAAPIVGQLTMSPVILGSARMTSLGYWIDRDHAGLGITPTAVALACDYAFAVLRLHRVEVCICPENQRSIRVVSKLGLRYEGVRPDYLHIGGRWRDHDVYAVHEDEAGDGLLVRLHRQP